MMIDTHCHLDAAEFAPDRDEVVAHARQVGIKAIVVPAVSKDNFAAVSAICMRYPDCYAAYGIHPLFTDQATEKDLDTLDAFLAGKQDVAPAVAVGEIGLDAWDAQRNPERQAVFFSAQLRLAQRYQLPVLLHIRRAVDEVLKQLRRIPVRGGIAHAFNGSMQQAQQLIDLGFKLGFGGALTSPRATHLRMLATNLPLSALVLETDAPDIPPVWLPPGQRRNTPGELAAIADCLARLRGISRADLLAQCRINTQAVLPALAN